MSTDLPVKTYESIQLNRVLAEILHPGGLDLTERMAQIATISRSSHILDVGCGRGKSIFFYASQYGCQATGLDLSPISVAMAFEGSVVEGLTDRVHFTVAGACQLPYVDSEFDAVFCECTLSLVNNKAEAFREIARVVRPGGWVVLADVVLKKMLSNAFKQELGFVCCFSEALTLEGYQEKALKVGLHQILVEDHSITLKQTAYKVSAGYGSLNEFWYQFGQGNLPCCNSNSPSPKTGSSGFGWKALFSQGKPGYWIMAWKKPEG